MRLIVSVMGHRSGLPAGVGSLRFLSERFVTGSIFDQIEECVHPNLIGAGFEDAIALDRPCRRRYTLPATGRPDDGPRPSGTRTCPL